MSKLVSLFGDGGKLQPEEAQRLIQDATALFLSQPSLVRIQVPVEGHLTVVGDVHGQIFDLLELFRQQGLPGPENPYLFNGDFVDRGSFSVEVILLLFACKVAFPQHVHLARGNHETHEMNVPYGFAGEAITKCGPEVYKKFQGAFDQLPLAHVVNDEIFVVHGGLPRKAGVTLEEIEALDRVTASSGRGGHELFTDLLWADPHRRNGYHPSSRGPGIQTFGPDVTARFLDHNGLRLVIRSHEVKDAGFEWAHNHRCLTVFSAPHYADAGDNRAAVVRLSRPDAEGELAVEIRPFDAAPRPGFYVPAMAYSPLNPKCKEWLTPQAVSSLVAFYK